MRQFDFRCRMRIGVEPAMRVGASRTAHNLPLTNRRPPRPALLRYLRPRAAGLGYVRGVVLARETGVAVGCDLTPHIPTVPQPSYKPLSPGSTSTLLGSGANSRMDGSLPRRSHSLPSKRRKSASRPNFPLADCFARSPGALPRRQDRTYPGKGRDPCRPCARAEITIRRNQGPLL